MEHRSELHRELAETEIEYICTRNRLNRRKRKLKELNSRTVGYRERRKLVAQTTAEADRLLRAKWEIIEELREMRRAETSSPEHRG